MQVTVWRWVCSQLRVFGLWGRRRRRRIFTYRVFFGGEMGQVAVVEEFCVFPVAADEVCFVCGHVDVWIAFFFVQWGWVGLTVGFSTVSGAR